MIEFVIANRILADQGIIADGFGHLSARSPTDANRFYMSRARAAGMVTVDDVMEFDASGQPLDQRGRRLFSERFLHAEARPEVNSVVHSAPTLLPFGVTGTPLGRSRIWRDFCCVLRQCLKSARLAATRPTCW